MVDWVRRLGQVSEPQTIRTQSLEKLCQNSAGKSITLEVYVDDNLTPLWDFVTSKSDLSGFDALFSPGEEDDVVTLVTFHCPKQLQPHLKQFRLLIETEEFSSEQISLSDLEILAETVAQAIASQNGLAVFWKL